MTPLDQALELAHAHEDKRRDFYSLFLRSEVLVPILNKPGLQEGTRRLKEDESFSLRIVMHKGRPVLPVFDTVERLQAWDRSGGRYIGIAMHALLPAIGADIHVWLNSGTPYGKEFVPDELNWLRGLARDSSPDPVGIKKGTEVRVGVPAHVPPELLARMISCLRKQKEVQAAHLGQVEIQKDAQGPHFALVLKTDTMTESALGAIFQEIGMSVQGILKGRPLDMMAYTDSGLPGAIVQMTKPFYMRS